MIVAEVVVEGSFRYIQARKLQHLFRWCAQDRVCSCGWLLICVVFGSVDSTSGRGRADKKNAIVELTLGEHKDGMNIPFCRECGVVCVWSCEWKKIRQNDKERMAADCFQSVCDPMKKGIHFQ